MTGESKILKEYLFNILKNNQYEIVDMIFSKYNDHVVVKLDYNSEKSQKDSECLQKTDPQECMSEQSTNQ